VEITSFVGRRHELAETRRTGRSRPPGDLPPRRREPRRPHPRQARGQQSGPGGELGRRAPGPL